MKKVIVVGQPNVGKTLFCLNFAEFLGMQSVTINFESYERGCSSRVITISEARPLLVNDHEHQTLDIQSMVLTMPWGKSVKQFELIDTTGLADRIDFESQIRKAMAQTLQFMRQADVVFHILDCFKVAQLGYLKGIGEIDYQIAQFGQLKKGYIILANKIDLPQAQEGLDRITLEFPGNKVIGISALTKKGFKEVREVARQLL
ncbi:MAG TPA: GTP-binding protein HSR1 [Firmicutes bacterium]|nr:GTP-binding protein HSR1 [Bacillota bacterium]